MSLALLDAQIKDEVMNILTPICENEDIEIVVGSKTNNGNLKHNRTFRVIYEEIETPGSYTGEHKARTFGGKYKLDIPIRITILINSKQIEKADMKSIQIISEVIDEVFLNKRFIGIAGVNDIQLDKIITAASLDIKAPTTIGSGIRLIIKAILNNCK